MAKAVGPPLGPVVCTLLVLIGACLSQCAGWEQCKDGLYLETDSPHINVETVEEKLEQAKKEGEDYIAGFKIDDILRYRDTSCKDVINYRDFLSPLNVHCGGDWDNEGLLKFQKFYIEQRRLSCADEILPWLRAAVETLGKKEQKILEDFYSGLQGFCHSERPEQAWLFGRRVFTESLTQNMKPFFSCIKLIKTLHGEYPCFEFLQLDPGHEFVELWSNISHTCKPYLLGVCSGQSESFYYSKFKHKMDIKKSRVCEQDFRGSMW